MTMTMTMTVRLWMIVLTVALFAVPAQAVTLSDRFTSFSVFGDSLSDPGNLYNATGNTRPQSPPYAGGRFSNGPVWAETVAGAFGDPVSAFAFGGRNFAFGGARAATDGDAIPDFDGQIGLFGGSPVSGPAALGSDPLASVWFGANDLLNGIAPATAIAAIDAGIRRLNADFGIDNFLIFNLPDLGVVPAAHLADPGDGSVTGAFSAATQVFNTGLAAAIAQLTSDLAVTVLRADMFSLFQDALAVPGAFGFGDTQTPCVIAAGGGNVLADCTNGGTTPGAVGDRLFFDTVHPTAAGHDVIAGLVLAKVSAPGGLALIVLGLSVLVLAARRRRGPGAV